ncbi:MAG: diacylglycerol kinase family protein [Bacillota bacterium]
MERFYCIVNPVAGSGKGKRSFLALKAVFERENIPYQVVYSAAPGHIQELARAAVAAGERKIVCIGGDGSMREAAGELLHTEAVLGLIPGGSGNDLCTALGIPDDIERAARILLEGHVRPIDAGLANRTPFFNVSGLGFDVQVLYKTEFYKKRLNGMLPYFLGILGALIHLNAFKIKFTIDGEGRIMNTILFCVANGQRFGGGMLVAPEANIGDGKFCVCAVDKVSLFTFLHLLPSFIKGRHTTKKPVHIYEGSVITVEADKECIVELDGELLERTPVTFRILPGALRVLAPQEV